MAIWIGPGVLSHKGRDYETGEELPELDEGVLDRLIAKGKAAKIEQPEAAEPEAAEPEAAAGPKQTRKGAKHD